MTEEILTINEQQYLVEYKNVLTDEQRNDLTKQISEIYATEQNINNLAYSLIFEDNFDGTSINRVKWPTLFNNSNWYPWTSASSNNISVSNGMVRLKLSKNTSGTGKPYIGTGFQNSTVSIKRGKFVVRARFPPGNTGVVGYISIWPTSGQWPPEIDFGETTGRNANTITFTQHYKTSSGAHARVPIILTNIDVTQFHTYTVELLTNNTIKWFVDGVQRGATQTNYSPNDNWFFGVGVWAGNCTTSYGGCPSGTFPKYLDMDYVRIYKQV